MAWDGMVMDTMTYGVRINGMTWIQYVADDPVHGPALPSMYSPIDLFAPWLAARLVIYILAYESTNELMTLASILDMFCA
jgi:hypothetical protein